MGRRKISNPSRILSLLLTMLIFVSAGDFASRLRASQSQDISVSVRLDAVPPTNITDLVASPDNTEDGKIDLVWTTPGDDGWVGELPDYPYKVKYDTRSVAGLGGTTTSWWEQAQWEYPAGGWSALNPGETDDTKWLAGLTPGTTYWIAIKAKDKVGNPALDANVAGCKAGDKVPEAPVGLTALAGDEKISISWSANTESDIAGYYVYYDTDTSGKPYANRVWVGNVTSYQLTDLTNFTTYHIAITAKDKTNHESAYSSEVAGYPADWVAPAAITDLVAFGGYNEVELQWTSPGDDNYSGAIANGLWRIAYSTNSNYQFSINNYQLEISTSCLPLTDHRLPITGLQGDTTYFFCVWTADEVPNWSEPSNIVSARTLDNVPPAAPVGLIAVGSDREIYLQWEGNIEADLAGYNLYRSTYSLGYSTIPINALLMSTTFYKDTELTNGVLYYYVVTALDINGNESGYSAEVVCMPRDSVPPREPAGVKGILSSDGKTITIRWSKVCQNVDGSQCTDLGGYNIYSADTIAGEYKLRAFIPTPNQNGSGQANGDLGWVEPNDTSEQVFYYLVKAIDTSENESRSSMIVDSSREQNIYATDEKDRWCHIGIPREINQVLYKGNNRYGDDVKIEVVRNEKEEIGRIGKSYTFMAKEGTTDEPIKDFAFAKPMAQIILTYGGVEKFTLNQSGSGQAPSPEEWAAKNLALFWFNGLEWIKLGGDVDPYHRIISIRSKRLGKYMIKQSLRASSFVIEDIQPDKTFTPNNDGWNDYFEIQYANPADGNVSGKIYDLRGRVIAGMEKGGNDETLIWDGKDENKRLVPGGVYIYQIEITGPESKVVNGTVVVAR